MFDNILSPEILFNSVRWNLGMPGNYQSQRDLRNSDLSCGLIAFLRNVSISAPCLVETRLSTILY